MNIKSKLRIAVTSLLTAVTCGMFLCACDNAIYDGEGDCTVHYKVKFLDNYNMTYGDAFAHDVTSVTLYLIDEAGNVVWQKTDAGVALAEDDYMMDVDVDPGQYSLLVWAGTMDKNSYTFANSTFGSELSCTLNRYYDTNRNAIVYSDLDGLYHGYVAGQEFPDSPGTYTYTVPLVKNTNSIRVVLQQMSGDMVDANKFSFCITADNGKMAWDNSLLPDENINYYAWNVELGESDMNWSFDATDDTETAVETENGTDENTDAETNSEADGGTDADTPAALKVSTRTILPSVFAEMTTCRLVKGQSTRLTVTNNETGETVFSIPLVEYALMVKDFYNASMDDQEFLDRQDSYEMVFFLDEGYRWMKTFIYINSWRIVLQSSDL